MTIQLETKTSDVRTLSKGRAAFSVVGATLGLLLAVIVGLNGLAIGRRLLKHAMHWPDKLGPQGIALFFVTGSALGELLALFVLWLVLRRRGDTLSCLGLRGKAPWLGWVAALAVALFSVVPAVLGDHSGPLHLPFLTIFFEPSFYHIYVALVAGCSAALCEEVFFRGFVMTRLADAGFGRIPQVLASGLLFGMAHGLYALSNGLMTGLDIMLHTALLGALYGLVFLLSRRSLIPCIVAHFLNDAIVLPWVFVQMFHTR